MRDWLNEQESITKYGTPAYAGWKLVDAQADWGAKHPGVPGVTTPTSATTTTTNVPLNFEGLMKQITTAPTGYPEAIKAEESRLPLIQQRYKALLDEIDLAESQGVTETKGAEKAQIGETQARAAAQGIFPGTVELGTEELTRQAALRTILGLGKEATVAKAKALADQASEEGDVSAAIAKLKISQADTETERYSTALDFLLKKQQIEKTGTGEANTAAARTALASDVKGGLNLETVVKKYAGAGLDLYEIVNAYDKGSPYKGHQEDWDTLMGWYSEGSAAAGTSIKEDDVDRAAKGTILNSDEYKNGNMTDEDVRISLLSAGSDPNLAFFKELYNNNPSKAKQVKAEQDKQKSKAKTQGVLDFIKSEMARPHWL